MKIPRIPEKERLKRFEIYDNNDLLHILSFREIEDKILYPIDENNHTRKDLLEAVMSSWSGKLVPPRNGKYGNENNLNVLGPYDDNQVYKLSDVGFFQNDTVTVSMSFWENPQFKQIVLGTYDKNSLLKKLCGNKDVLTKIFMMVVEDCVQNIIHEPLYRNISSFEVKFPDPIGININMMPFYLFKKESLPVICHSYWNIIASCGQYGAIEYHKRDTVMAYLTINESEVEAGKTQRRPGLHIDSTRSFSNESKSKSYFWRWGYGNIFPGYKFDGGIYMASNIDRSTSIYPCELTEPHEISMDGGNVENLKGLLGTPMYTRKNHLYWMTDCVPHEAIPMRKREYRQFFRLVVGEISVWYSQHSTPNPLGITTPATIINTNKFTEN